MTDLLDAIIHLCDALLTFFIKDFPRKKWMIIVGSLIAVIGLIVLIIWFILVLRPAAHSNL